MWGGPQRRLTVAGERAPTLQARNFHLIPRGWGHALNFTDPARAASSGAIGRCRGSGRQRGGCGRRRSTAASVPVASASAAPPDFLGTLAGPSRAAMYPSGLEYDAVNNRLVVADTGRDRILFYSLAGDPLGGFGSYGTGDGQFASPRDVAVDEAGQHLRRRRREQPDPGVHQRRRASSGGRVDRAPGNDNLNTPIGVTWDAANDVLLVASTGQNLIKAFNADGVFQWKSPDRQCTGSASRQSAPRDVTRGPDGKLWVTAYEQHQIKVFDVGADGVWTEQHPPPRCWATAAAAGHGVDQMNFPYNVVFSADGNTSTSPTPATAGSCAGTSPEPTPVWMTPFGGHCDNHPQPCADPPADAGKFNHLRRVVIDPAGNIYGADFWGAGIEVFTPTGAPIRVDRGLRAARTRASPRRTAWTCADERQGLRDGPAQPPDPALQAQRHVHRRQGRCPRHPAGNVLLARGRRPSRRTAACGPSTPAATGSSSSRPSLSATARSAAGRRHRQPPSASSTTPRTPTSTPTAWCGSPTPATTGSRSTTPVDQHLLRRRFRSGTGNGQFTQTRWASP